MRTTMNLNGKVLEEVKQIRDKCIGYKEDGGVGYDPAIALYTRIIEEIETLQRTIEQERAL